MNRSHPYKYTHQRMVLQCDNTTINVKNTRNFWIEFLNADW